MGEDEEGEDDVINTGEFLWGSWVWQ